MLRVRHPTTIITNTSTNQDANLDRTARVGVLRPPRRPLPLLLHRLALHPARQALLVPAVLASVPLSLVDDAVPLLAAGVREVLPHRPLEEAFAAFATAKKNNDTTCA